MISQRRLLKGSAAAHMLHWVASLVSPTSCAKQSGSASTALGDSAIPTTIFDLLNAISEAGRSVHIAPTVSSLANIYQVPGLGEHPVNSLRAGADGV